MKKTEQEWRQQLTEEQYRVTRQRVLSILLAAPYCTIKQQAVITVSVVSSPCLILQISLTPAVVGHHLVKPSKVRSSMKKITLMA